MNEHWIEFQRCRSAESVGEVTRILEAAGIPHRMGSTAAVFDFMGIGSESGAEVIVSVPKEDYEAARMAMEEEYLKGDLPEDHYLLQSSDEELAEIVGQSSEWSAFDVAHARRLLCERGADFGMIGRMREERLAKLKGGKRASGLLLSVGWIFSLLGGLIGLGIAWSLVSMKEKTPDGDFHTYDEPSRRIGRKMLWVACVIFSLVLVLRVRQLLTS